MPSTLISSSVFVVWIYFCMSFRDVDCQALRLSDGISPNSGRLEIHKDGRWGTICRNGFDVNSAAVACRQMGYRGYSAMMRRTARSAAYHVPIYMSEVRCNGDEESLLNCSHIQSARRCYHSKDVAIICVNKTSAGFPLRLEGGTMSSNGKLQIQIDGIWGRICGAVDAKAAALACKNMGYSAVDAAGNYYPQQRRYASSPVWLQNIVCNGSESNLLECSHKGLGVHGCNEYSGIDIGCLSHSTDSVPLRLQDGMSPNSGRLEINISGQWGSICRNTFDMKDAIVACRNMGYWGISAVVSGGPDREAAIFFGGFECNATESHLLDCPHRGTPRCIGDLPVSIVCTNQTAVGANRSRKCRYLFPNGISQVGKAEEAIECSDFPGPMGNPCRNNECRTIIPTRKLGNPTFSTESVAFRLVDKKSPNSGRLEMHIDGLWRAVHKNQFDLEDVNVACRNMGYRGINGFIWMVEKRWATFPIYVDELECDGTESYLFNCPYSGRADYHPLHFGIVCTNQTKEKVPLRLADGQTPNSGKLEIEIDGVWGGVCRSQFDQKDARVACRNMGYWGLSGILLTTEQRRLAGFGPASSVWLDNMQCNGKESYLMDCAHSGLGRQNCAYKTEISIVCTNQSTDDPPLRLADRITPNSGRLEMQVGGVWGTIHNDGFDIKAANVACRNMGYSAADGIGGIMDQPLYMGDVPIWLSKVNCTGNETSLLSCSYEGLGISYNSHNKDVTVRCLDKSADSFPLRLVDGIMSNSGRLEIEVDGVWGTVCKQNFDETDGNVACRALGFWKLHRLIPVKPQPLAATSPIWLDNLQCTGSESNLLECPHKGLGIHSCTHDDDVGIQCLNQSAIFTRLQNGIRPNVGRLEIQINGVWGTICNRKFDRNDADVACRTLGYKEAYSIIGKMDQLKTDSVLTIWLDHLNCTGIESHLFDCPHRGIGIHNCRHDQDVGLKCLDMTTVSARLMDGEASHSGRLEIKIDDVWGTACRRSFGQADATVACRMLGYKGTSSILTGSRSKGLKLQGTPIWFDKLHCDGTESSLLDCNHSPIGRHGCGHSEDVWINCFNQTSETGA